MTGIFRPTAPSAEANGSGMNRLQFELALDVGGTRRPLVEAVRDAAQSAGAELLFVLPDSTGQGAIAVVRLCEDGRDSFLQVASSGDGYSIVDETAMDAALLEFARASVDLFERMSADDAISAPLAEG